MAFNQPNKNSVCCFLAPTPKVGSKTQSGVFQRKQTAFLSKKVCYTVHLCENYQRQSCKAFTGRSNGGEQIVGWETSP